MDIPEYGHVKGDWDLRGGVRDYLGGVDFKGKRVLDVGTASGFLCFYMEQQGAEVVGFDLSKDESWDIVPYQRYDYERFLLDQREKIGRLNNGFWLAHKAFRSSVKMVYGSVYQIPPEIGTVDISVFGSVLLHLRDPFLALQNALRLTRETVIVTEAYRSLSLRGFYRSLRFPLRPWNLGKTCMGFLPDFKTCEPKETWWQLTPSIIQRFLAVLGFEKTQVQRHTQKKRTTDTGYSLL
jgi:SAM-dependent methyltransferase